MINLREFQNHIVSFAQKSNKQESKQKKITFWLLNLRSSPQIIWKTKKIPKPKDKKHKIFKSYDEKKEYLNKHKILRLLNALDEKTKKNGKITFRICAIRSLHLNLSKNLIYIIYIFSVEIWLIN